MSDKPNHPPIITPSQRETIAQLGHEDITQAGCEFVTEKWPLFRCAVCQEVSVGGENWRLGPAADDPEKMVLYLGCANVTCRAVYHTQLQMLQVGTWMTEEMLAEEAEGATKQ